MGINRRKFLKSVGLGTIMLGAQPLTALASEALVSDSSSQDRKILQMMNLKFRSVTILLLLIQSMER